ncbi:hypothetical protein HCN44_008106 [Aphidius gifuensis]|uniref:Uncharacterized protein n=1 Tax=Aphidius gifuensis TaxID=684658 RepID=A0A835CMM7_APHGI|nr:uncharacterized protein LOC122857807 [Aphidius gifuensis]KAF7989432.1 hypothetical protein HCN44_008106 [Aphidius gifuensis]
MKNKQDLSNNENSVDDTSEAKIDKHRSIIFQRRSLAPIQQQDEVSNENNETTNEQTFDIIEYIQKLKNEREIWTKTLRERKSKFRRIDKKIRNHMNNTNLDLSILSDEQKKYIQSKPNYEKISSNINNLIDVAVKETIINETINHLKKNLDEQIKRDINLYTKKIILLDNNI